jgi:hypothetical protein
MIAVELIERIKSELFATFTFETIQELDFFIKSRTAENISYVRHVISKSKKLVDFFEKNYNPKFYLIREKTIELLPIKKSEKRGLTQTKRTNKEKVFNKTLVRIKHELDKEFKKENFKSSVFSLYKTSEAVEVFQVVLSDKKTKHVFNISFNKIAWKFEFLKVETTNPLNTFKRLNKVLKAKTEPTRIYRKAHKVIFNEDNS